MHFFHRLKPCGNLSPNIQHSLKSHAGGISLAITNCIPLTQTVIAIVEKQSQASILADVGVPANI
jgi:hypothetical protein